MWKAKRWKIRGDKGGRGATSCGSWRHARLICGKATRQEITGVSGEVLEKFPAFVLFLPTGFLFEIAQMRFSDCFGYQTLGELLPFRVEVSLFRHSNWRELQLEHLNGLGFLSSRLPAFGKLRDVTPSRGALA